MLLINNDYRNVNLKNKVDFILTDIPYNIGLKAYASNPQWWNKGDFIKCLKQNSYEELNGCDKYE